MLCEIYACAARTETCAVEVCTVRCLRQVIKFCMNRSRASLAAVSASLFIGSPLGNRSTALNDLQHLRNSSQEAVTNASLSLSNFQRAQPFTAARRRVSNYPAAVIDPMSAAVTLACSGEVWVIGSDWR